MSATTLWEAAETGNLDEAVALIKSGVKIDQRSPVGLTPLMIAAGRGDARMVMLLLNAGADVHCVDACAGASVLHKACQGGNVDVVKLLVEKGAFIDLPAATTGHTPLWDALWYKYPDIVQFLLDNGAGLGTKAYYGFTLEEHIRFEENVNPTEEAREKFRKARAMVEARVHADRQAADRQLLMAAVTRGDLATVKELLATGTVAVDERFPKQNGFNDLHTPLLVACRDGHTEIACELIRAGANVNAVEPTFGAVPLHKAVYNGHAGITQLLAEQPGIDLNFQGATNGYTPLHDALWHGYRDCARILLHAGARLDVRGHDGKRPLEIAVATLGYDDALVGDLRARTPDAGAPPPRPARDERLPFYVQMRWNIEGRISLDELWNLELKEAEWAMTSGPQAQLWKVAGDRRIVGIVYVDSIDELDRIILGRLPLREYLEFEEIWPLRPYGDFVEDVKKHYRV